MKKHIKKLDFQLILIIISLLSFFQPGILEFSDISPFFRYIEIILNLIRILTTFYCVYQIFRNKIYKDLYCLKKYIMILILFWFSIFLSTLIHQHYSVLSNVLILSVSATVLFIYISILCKKNFKKLMKSISILFGIYLILNFLTIIFFPNGIGWSTQPIYFLGIKNSITLPVIFSILFSIIDDYLFFNRITLKTIFIYIIAILSALLADCSTALIIILLSIIILFVFDLLNSKTTYNLSYFYLFYIICFVIFVLLNIVLIINNIFDIELSFFTNREQIWALAIPLIFKSLFLGYGMFDNGGYIYIWGNNYYSHNEILEICLWGGIISLAFYLLLFFFSSKILKTQNNYFYKILSWIISLYLISGFMESNFISMYIYLIFAIVFSFKQYNQVLSISYNNPQISLIKNSFKFYKFYLRKKFICKKMINKLDDTDFSLLSIDCLGGIILHDFGLKFNSPTINLWMYPEDFYKYITNIKYYSSLSLKFVDKKGYDYPVAILGDIYIYFTHYKSQLEAKQKWEQRTKRLNYNKILVIVTDGNNCSIDMLKKFNDLSIPCIAFTHKKIDLNNTFYCKSNFQGLFNAYVSLFSLKRYYDDFDFVTWINKSLTERKNTNNERN